MKKLLLINLFILQSFGLMASDLRKENNNDWQTYNNNNLNPKPSRLDALLAVLPIFIEQNNNDQLQSNQESSHTPLIQKNTQEDRSSLKRKHKNDDCDSDDCDDNYTTKRKPMIDGIEQDTTKYPHYYKKDKEDGFWKCTFPECRNNYKTKISSNIIAHNRSHTDDKPYQCEYTGCKKAFTQSSNLKKHTRTHTNEKPYTCTEIGHTKAFTTSSELTMHRSKNTDEKPYKCTHPGCIKAFTQPGDLTIHRRKHPGEKPCRSTDPERTYTFADDSNLRKHTNSLHKIVLNNNAKDDVTNNIKENDDKSYDSTNN